MRINKILNKYGYNKRLTPFWLDLLSRQNFLFAVFRPFPRIWAWNCIFLDAFMTNHIKLHLSVDQFRYDSIWSSNICLPGKPIFEIGYAVSYSVVTNGFICSWSHDERTKKMTAIMPITCTTNHKTLSSPKLDDFFFTKLFNRIKLTFFTFRTWWL